jgi:hypothetical protein
MEEFKNDPARADYLAARNAYNAEHGIYFDVVRA